jgi:O-antigen ligase
LSKHLYQGLLIAIVAWGLLTFGAVYPWGYRPLLLTAAALGVWGLVRRDRFPAPYDWRVLAVGLAAVGAAIAVQLVPFDRGTLRQISPATDAFLIRYDVAYGAAAAGGLPVQHPLSLRPENTWRGLWSFAALSLLLLGVSRNLSTRRLRTLAVALLVLGALVGMEGIAQKASGTMKLYGFWTPEAVITPFGPFVNRNHFAGWMIMATSLGLGYFWGALVREEDAAATRRDRIAWLASSGANRLALVLVALVVMGLSIAFTVSRSGIAAFAVALAISASAVMRNASPRIRRISLALTAALLVAAVGLTGLDAILDRYAMASSTGMGGRLAAWGDALEIVADFPVFGVGLNAFGTAMLLYQRPDLQAFWQEAHNDYLHLAAEGGLLLGVPLVCTLLVFVIAVRRRFREARDDRDTYWIRIGAVTALLGIAVQELVEFSLQIPGNAALFAIAAAMAIHRPPDRRTHAAA